MSLWQSFVAVVVVMLVVLSVRFACFLSLACEAVVKVLNPVLLYAKSPLRTDETT